MGPKRPPPPPPPRPAPPPPPRPVPPPPPPPRYAPPPPPPPRHAMPHSHSRHTQAYEYYGIVSPKMLVLPWSGELPDIPGTSVTGRDEMDVISKLTQRLNEAIDREMRFGRMPVQAPYHELTMRYPGRRLVVITPTVRY